jgi:hypothetical protein
VREEGLRYELTELPALYERGLISALLTEQVGLSEPKREALDALLAEQRQSPLSLPSIAPHYRSIALNR